MFNDMCIHILKLYNKARNGKFTGQITGINTIIETGTNSRPAIPRTVPISCGENPSYT